MLPRGIIGILIYSIAQVNLDIKCRCGYWNTYKREPTECLDIGTEHFQGIVQSKFGYWNKFKGDKKNFAIATFPIRRLGAKGSYLPL